MRPAWITDEGLERARLQDLEREKAALERLERRKLRALTNPRVAARLVREGHLEYAFVRHPVGSEAETPQEVPDARSSPEAE